MASFWPHLQTICWLRWRLTRNQLERSGTVNKVVTLILLFSGLGLAAASGVGGLLGGWFGLTRAPVWVQLLVWDVIVGGFLGFWLVSLLVEIQRSESIDMNRMLHLPVSPGQIFFLNYLASHLTPILIITVPGLLGLSLGMVLARGPVMAPLVFLVLGFLFMVTSWTYGLRGWLARLMINKRRRRTIVVALTVAFILLAQLPNLYFNVYRSSAKEDPSDSVKITTVAAGPKEAQLRDRILGPASTRLHQWIPFLWLPAGAKGLAENNPWPALLGFLGTLGLGVVGLRHAYRTTLRFYQGKSRPRKIPAAPDRSATASQPSKFMEYRLPAVPDQVAAVAMTSLRSLLRAPEAKMALLMPFIMIVIFGSMLFRKQSVHMALLTPFLPAGLAFILLFGLMQIAMNQFGYDRNGFRSLVLLPVPRRHLLMGKNLALLGLCLPVFVLLSMLMLASGTVAPLVVLGGVLQFLTGFILLCLLGNWASVIAPFRVAMGSLKRSKSRHTVSLILLGLTMVFPLAMLPVIVPSLVQVTLSSLNVLPGVPWSFLVALPLLLGSVLLYRTVVQHQGHLLEKREKQVLEVVTHEQE